LHCAPLPFDAGAKSKFAVKTVLASRLQSTGIAYRSSVHGPVDFRIGNGYGGRMVYWNEPDDHQWEMLTVSYARQSEEDKGRR